MKAALLVSLMVLGAVSLRGGDRKPFELTTLMGETYHGCRIIKVTPEALTIIYDSGVSKVPFELLGDSWKELYHYDPEKAHEYAEQEEAKRKEAEARRLEALKVAEKPNDPQMSDLVKMEHQRQEFEAKMAKEQAEAAAKAAAVPPQLVPFPGDGTVPQNPPIGPVYTPGQTDVPMNGGVYYPPGYTTGNPYVYTPGYVYPPVVVVPPPRPPFRGPGLGMNRRPGRGPWQH
jgi:hypothetical protein